MTILLTGYASKKDLKASIGEPLKYEETSMFGPEYVSNGFVTGARRPHLLGGGREFFARVELVDGLIAAVS
jgi:hypothetical protein